MGKRWLLFFWAICAVALMAAGTASASHAKVLPRVAGGDTTTSPIDVEDSVNISVGNQFGRNQIRDNEMFYVYRIAIEVNPLQALPPPKLALDPNKTVFTHSTGTEGLQWKADAILRDSDGHVRRIEFVAATPADALPNTYERQSQPGTELHFTVVWDVVNEPAANKEFELYIIGYERDPATGDERLARTSPNEIPNSITITVGDDADPRVQSATALDTNADGAYDAVAVTFTEPVRKKGLDASVTKGYWRLGEKAVQAHVVDAISHGDRVTAATLRFPEAAPGTGTPPQLTYTGGAGVRDFADRFMQPIGPADIEEIDAAAPRIASVTTVADGTGRINGLDVVFTEPVNTQGLTPGNWTIQGCTCGPITIHDSDPADTMVRLAFPATGDTGTLPSVFLTAGAVRDQQEIANAALADVGAKDGANPLVLRVVTVDGGPQGADGHLDALTVTFSEPVFVGSYKPLDWASDVQLGTASPAGYARELTLPIRDAAFDTSTTPTLSFRGSGLVDLAGHQVPQFQVTALDRAAPVVRLHVVEEGDRVVTGQLSEPASTVTEYVNNNPGGATAVLASDAAGVRVTLDAPISPDDVAADALRITTSDGTNSLTQSHLLLSDRAYLAAVTADVGSREILLRFTDDVTGISGTPTHRDVKLSGLPAGQRLESQTGALWTLHLTEPVTASQLHGATVEARENRLIRVSDGAVVPHRAIPVHDRIAPAVARAITADDDGDGTTDSLTIQFTEPLNGVLQANEWSIQTTNGTRAPTSIAWVEVDGQRSAVRLQPPTDLPGDLLPQFWYNGTSLRDTSPNANPLGMIRGAVAADGVIPVTTATINQQVGPSGWISWHPVVTLATTENLAVTRYKVDTPAGQGQWRIYEEPFMISHEGNVTVWYETTDVSGNAETPKRLPLAIDTRAPEAVANAPRVALLHDAIVISWQPTQDVSPGSGLKGYQVWANGGLVTTVPASGTLAKFTPESDGLTWSIRIRALDHSGIISQFSPPSRNITFHFAHGGDTADSTAPETNGTGQLDLAQATQSVGASVRVEATRDGTKVSWDPLAAGTAPMGFLVWRDTGSGHQCMADVPFGASQFIDENAPVGARYLVSPYFGKTPLEGHASATGTCTNDLRAYNVPGFQEALVLSSGGVSVADIGDDWSPMWWTLAGLTILVIVAAVVAVVVRSRWSEDQVEAAPVERRRERIAWDPADRQS